MGKKNTDAELNYKKTAGANFKRIRESLKLGQAEFFDAYLQPLADPEGKVRDILAKRQYTGRLERGMSAIDVEVLLMYSRLANVSINDLYTKTIEEDTKSLHEVISGLFTVLEGTPLEVAEDKEGYYIRLSKQNKLNLTADELKSIKSEFDNALQESIDNANEEQRISFIIAEFLKEYQTNASKSFYKEWKKQLLSGSYSYSVDGQLIEQDGTNEAINQLIDGGKAELSEDFKARLNEYVRMFEEWKKTSDSDSAEEFLEYKRDYDSTPQSVKDHVEKVEAKLYAANSNDAYVAEKPSEYNAKRRYDDLAQMTILDLFKEVLRTEADKH